MIEKKIYLVGGAVRDKLLNEINYDKDYIAVGYKPKDFSHLKQVGKDFPVFITENGDELALARVERKISSGYNGFSVDTSNVALEEDLKRRDLTINSIAYDEKNNIIIDPFNGQDDLEKKTLRHTSEAFVEDPIRVLRIARFRAKYGYNWKIHHTTKVLIYQMKEELKSLEVNRVYKEISKVLELENSHIFFETLFELGVLEDIFPSIYKLTTLKEGSVYHLEPTLFEHTMMVLKELKNKSALLKLTAIYHDIAKPYTYRTYGNSSGHEKTELVIPRIDMLLPVKLQKKMLILIKNHIKIYTFLEMKPSKIATFFESFRKDRKLMEDLITFSDADNQGRTCFKEKQNLDRKLILNIFDDISNYSPKKWIDSQEKEELSANAIRQHIHNYNTSVVKQHIGKIH